MTERLTDKRRSERHYRYPPNIALVPLIVLVLLIVVFSECTTRGIHLR